MMKRIYIICFILSVIFFLLPISDCEAETYYLIKQSDIKKLGNMKLWIEVCDQLSPKSKFLQKKLFSIKEVFDSIDKGVLITLEGDFSDGIFTKEDRPRKNQISRGLRKYRKEKISLEERLDLIKGEIRLLEMKILKLENKKKKRGE